MYGTSSLADTSFAPKQTAARDRTARCNTYISPDDCMRENNGPMYGRTLLSSNRYRGGQDVSSEKRHPGLNKRIACRSEITRSPTDRPLRPVGSASAQPVAQSVEGKNERRRIYSVCLPYPICRNQGRLRLRGSQAFPGTNREERIKVKNRCRCRGLHGQ